MEYTNKFDSSVEKFMGKYIRKPQIVYGIIVLIITMYAAQVAPQLPKTVTNVFNNSFFKLFFMILILWVAQINPTISILIAVAFLLTVNYANNKTFFEMLDNTTTPMPQIKPTAIDSVNAVNQLTLQAMSPNAGTTANVTNAANIAVSTMAPSDTKGIQSVAALAQQALQPTAGNAPTVAADMTNAVTAINTNIPATITPAAVSQAIQVLSNSAASPAANNVSVVQTASNIATTAVPQTTNTPNIVAAIQSLANAAVTPTPINAQAVAQTTQAVVAAITTPPPTTMVPATTMAPATTMVPATTMAPLPTDVSSGCYPMRSIDMSKVQPEIEGNSIEDYQTFTPSM